MIKRIISKRNRNLLSEMIRTDFKLRYQGSILGYLWSLLKPLMLFAIMYTVFTKFLNIGRGVPRIAASRAVSMPVSAMPWRKNTKPSHCSITTPRPIRIG